MAEDIDIVRTRLRNAGASDSDLAHAITLELLYRLSGDLGNRPAGEQISLLEIAARAEVPVDVVQRFFRAAGLAADDLDARVWYSSDPPTRAVASRTAMSWSRTGTATDRS